MSKAYPANQTHDEVVQQLLERRPDFAAAYVENAAEGAIDEEGIAIFVGSLRRVAKFRGMTEVAAMAGMKPESLSRALSKRGNPTLKTLLCVTQALGVKFALVPAGPPKSAPRKKRAAAKKPPRKATA